MHLSYVLTKYQISAFIASSVLLFSSFSTSYALSLNNLPAESESQPFASLEKSEQLKKQRKLFVQAENALKRGRYTQYRKIEPRLTDYPLYPYLLFRKLERRIISTSDQKIQHFLLTYHDTPLANKLYYRWINSLARRGKSNALVRYFRPTQNTRLLCHYANALHKTGKKGKAFSLMGELWLTGE
jgi:soluble lytic murein transglycosylase